VSLLDGSRGFTLIELLLVVAILSAVAMAAFGLAAEDRGETRREDTLNRLAFLRRATLGTETPAYGGEMRLSGFVADNGRLPVNVAELTVGKSGGIGTALQLAEKKGRTPFYAKKFVGTKNCVQEKPSDPPPYFDESAALLLKGYRSGGYLAGMTRGETFRDGWGNVDANVTPDYEDDKNFGWAVKPDGDSLTFTSYGADNRMDDPDHPKNGNDPEADQSRTIYKEDWKVPLAGWQVFFRNADPLDASTIDFSKLSIALLVFRNDGSANGEWLRFTGKDNDCPVYDASDPTAIIQLASGSSCTLTFADEVDCDGEVFAEIPIGRHLVLLLDEDGNEPFKYKSGPNNGKKIFAQAAFYPGASRPVITLDIR
jgi:prepilin-type N-terminal cleavage/methylation domain-containing protein